MAEDIRLTEDRGFEIDPTGDLDTISGTDNVLQQAALAAYPEIRNLRGQTITNADVRATENALVEALESYDGIENVAEVRITEIDGSQITLDIAAQSDLVTGTVVI